MSQFIENVSSLFPDTDNVILEYLKEYLIQTPFQDFKENFYEFVSPFFPEDSRLEEICNEYLASVNVESTLKSESNNDFLDKPVKMEFSSQNDSSDIRQKADISLVSTTGRFLPTLTSVNRKKLDKIEAKMTKKKNIRASSIEYVDPRSDRTDYMSLNTLIDPSLSKGKSKDIKIENFDISYGGKKILSNSCLNLVFGRRYGLVGRNGVGKSTLLRHFSRRDISGTIGKVPEWLRILHVEQEVEGDDTTVLQSVLQADAFRMALLRKESELTKILHSKSCDVDAVNKNLEEIYEKLVEIESDKAESNASVILYGLGFKASELNQPTKTFSGGWRMRIALARALFCKPDILLCDEPTNHCDINAVIWLEKYLKSWPNTLLLVSHDRDFLDEVVTDVIHMHNEKLDFYKGNFSMFMASRDEKRRNQQKEYDAQLQYRQHLQDFIDKWRYNAKRAPQAQSKIKILDKLPKLEPPEDDGVDDGEVKFRWPNPVDKLSPPILQADDVDFSYKYTDENGTHEKSVLKNISFSVQLDSRIAIVGSNGAGKSTLLKGLVGLLNPSRGIIQRNPRLRLAYFSQHHVDALEDDETVKTVSPLEFLMNKYPGNDEEMYRQILGRFGISGGSALQPIRTLSGGQKSRVVFAMMAMTNPHILVLDEVSNHLDIMTVESLIRALNGKTGFQGGVVLVSHDARFIDSVCNEMWVCKDGKLEKFVPEISSIMIANTGEGDGIVKGSSGILDYKKRIIRDIEKK